MSNVLMVAQILGLVCAMFFGAGFLFVVIRIVWKTIVWEFEDILEWYKHRKRGNR